MSFAQDLDRRFCQACQGMFLLIFAWNTSMCIREFCTLSFSAPLTLLQLVGISLCFIPLHKPPLRYTFTSTPIHIQTSKPTSLLQTRAAFRRVHIDERERMACDHLGCKAKACVELNRRHCWCLQHISSTTHRDTTPARGSTTGVSSMF